MKSIFKLTSLSLPALLLAMFPATPVTAQEGVEESVEQLADEIGEAIESWVEENDIEDRCSQIPHRLHREPCGRPRVKEVVSLGPGDPCKKRHCSVIHGTPGLRTPH